MAFLSFLVYQSFVNIGAVSTFTLASVVGLSLSTLLSTLLRFTVLESAVGLFSVVVSLLMMSRTSLDGSFAGIRAGWILVIASASSLRML